MIEQAIEDSISALFGMPSVEYSGGINRNAGTVYYTFDDITVVTVKNKSQSVEARCTLSILCNRDRVGIGYISAVLMDFEAKNSKVKIIADGNRESRFWISEDSFIMSKSVIITTAADFDLSREKINGVNINEIKGK